jgi:hypothetical protein
MKPIDQLKALWLENTREKYPDFPEKWMPPPPKYTDKTANGLTKCVIDYIRFKGGQAERISVTGRYVDNSNVVEDCIGRKRKIGSGKFIGSSMQKGSADISSIVPNPLFKFGIPVKWEVKMKDKQSEAQKTYQSHVEQAKGFYFIIHTFDEFLDYYNQIINETPF